MSTVLSDLIENVDRAFAHTARVSDDDLLPELHRLIQTIARDPRSSAAWDELRRAAHDEVRDVLRTDAEIVSELVAVRHELTRLYPELGRDASAVPPELGHPAWHQYERTLAHFDHRANQAGSVSLVPVSASAPARLRSIELGEILRARIAQADPPGAPTPEALAPASASFRAIIERRDQLLHRWRLFVRSDPSAAAIRVSALATWTGETMTQRYSPPFDADRVLAGDWVSRFASLRARAVGDGATLPGFERPGPLSPSARDEAAAGAELRADLGRVHEALRRSLALTRTTITLVERFRQRSQQFDRAELHAIAMRSTRVAENRLTDRFARFMFDQGLNPITRANLGTVQPDLLDPTAPTTFYVEAKRYRERKSVRTVAQWYWQVSDTLLRVQGLPRGIREAFLVVFRLSGPLYHLPEVPHGGVTIRPIVVDLAPSKQGGSRQRHAPIAIERDAIVPVLSALETSLPTAKVKRRR